MDFHSFFRSRLGLLLVCMLLPMSVYAQRLDIHGVITDEAGEPVPGVAVLVKGTVMGTATDLDGNFAISNVDPKSVLEISSIGFLTQEIREIQITM